MNTRPRSIARTLTATFTTAALGACLTGCIADTETGEWEEDFEEVGEASQEVVGKAVSSAGEVVKINDCNGISLNRYFVLTSASCWQWQTKRYSNRPNHPIPTDDTVSVHVDYSSGPIRAYYGAATRIPYGWRQAIGHKLIADVYQTDAWFLSSYPSARNDASDLALVYLPGGMGRFHRAWMHNGREAPESGGVELLGWGFGLGAAPQALRSDVNGYLIASSLPNLLVSRNLNPCIGDRGAAIRQETTSSIKPVLGLLGALPSGFCDRDYTQHNSAAIEDERIVTCGGLVYRGARGIRPARAFR